jgi:anti-anti-sigma factor
VTHEQLGTAALVRVSGEIDLTTVARLDEALLATSSTHVILDLTDLEFLDSAGIRALDLAHRQLEGEGRSLLIVAPAGSRAAWTLRVAGFEDGFVRQSLEDAAAESAEKSP